jgi:hypothetical protein
MCGRNTGKLNKGTDKPWCQFLSGTPIDLRKAAALVICGQIAKLNRTERGTDFINAIVISQANHIAGTLVTAIAYFAPV